MNQFSAFIFLLALLVHATSLQAQHLPHFSQQKTAATGSRLIAAYRGHGTSAGNYDHTDSSTYSYSGNRGSSMFDQRTSYNWDGASNAYIPTFRLTITYDAQNNPLLAIEEQWVSG